MTLRDRVLQSVARTPAPTRAEQRRRTSLVIATFAAGLALAATVGHHARRPRPELAVALGAHAVAIAASTWWLAVPGGPLGRARPLVRASAAAALLLLTVAALAGTGPSSNSVHLPCFLMDLGLGGVFFVVAAFGLRLFDPVAPRATAAAVGVLALSWASLAMTLHCSLAAPLHVLATHLAPGLAFVLAGAAFGHRWLGVR